MTVSYRCRAWAWLIGTFGLLVVPGYEWPDGRRNRRNAAQTKAAAPTKQRSPYKMWRRQAAPRQRHDGYAQKQQRSSGHDQRQVHPAQEVSSRLIRRRTEASLLACSAQADRSPHNEAIDHDNPRDNDRPPLLREREHPKHQKCDGAIDDHPKPIVSQDPSMPDGPCPAMDGSVPLRRVRTTLGA
jgi:hypothetical protein